MKRSIARIWESPDTATDVVAELKAELKAYDVDVEMDIEYRNQVTDSFYADAHEGRGDGQHGGSVDQAG